MRSIQIIYLIALSLSFIQCSQQSNENSEYIITAYGAIADGATKNTEAIQRAIDEASEAGGGKVVVPSGTFVTGSIFLKSNVNLHLTQGATLLGSGDSTDYPLYPPQFDSWTNRYQHCAMIFSENTKNISITGQGTLDFNGEGKDFYMSYEEWKRLENEKKRPFGIHFRRSERILIEGVKMLGGAFWTQHYLECENLRIDGIFVRGHAAYNNDGLDINNCKNVVVTNSTIYSSDDGICIKSTTPKKNENITISNCIVRTHYNAFKIGTETMGGVNQLTLTNCNFGSPGYANKHPTAGYFNSIENDSIGWSGIAIETCDGADIENIDISNITIDNMRAAIFIRREDRGRKYKEDMDRPTPGVMRNISISNVKATNMTRTSSSITGVPGYKVENINLSNIQIEITGGGTKEDVDIPVPEMEDKYPDYLMFRTYLPSYGMYVRHADNITFDNVQFTTKEDDARYAIYFDDVNVIDIDGLKTEQTGSNLGVVAFKNSSNALVRNGRHIGSAKVYSKVLKGSVNIKTSNNAIIE